MVKTLELFGGIGAPRKALLNAKYRDWETFDIQSEYWINEVDKDLGSSTLGDSVALLGTGEHLKHGRNFLDAKVYNIEHKGLVS